MNGALLINKHKGISSFGIIELLQRQLFEKGLKRRDLPKLGHGGTLDPFATGLLIVLVGKGVKLARYFLGSNKAYEGTIRFGETSISGDCTGDVSERAEKVPESLAFLQDVAYRLTLQPYLQTPPMHSAKKKDGKPLYELARAGIEVEREPKLCHLYEFNVTEYQSPQAQFNMKCSSGTYVRTLSQDYARMMGTVGLLDSLHRTESGIFKVSGAWTVQQVQESGKPWNELPCWISFDALLNGYDRAQATPEERQALLQGKQSVLFNIIKRYEPSTHPRFSKEDFVAVYCGESLIAIARKDQEVWGIERVFT